jgi:hypothetical protein
MHNPLFLLAQCVYRGWESCVGAVYKGVELNPTYPHPVGVYGFIHHSTHTPHTALGHTYPPIFSSFWIRTWWVVHGFHRPLLLLLLGFNLLIHSNNNAWHLATNSNNGLGRNGEV